MYDLLNLMHFEMLHIALEYKNQRSSLKGHGHNCTPEQPYIVATYVNVSLMSQQCKHLITHVYKTLKIIIIKRFLTETILNMKHKKHIKRI